MTWRKRIFGTALVAAIASVAGAQDEAEDPTRPARLAPLDSDHPAGQPRLLVIEHTGRPVANRVVLRLENATPHTLHVDARNCREPAVAYLPVGEPLPDWRHMVWFTDLVVVSVPPRMSWTFETSCWNHPEKVRYLVHLADGAESGREWIVSRPCRHPQVGPACPGRYVSLSFVEWATVDGRRWGLLRLNNPTREPIAYVSGLGVDPWVTVINDSRPRYGTRIHIPCNLMARTPTLGPRSSLLFATRVRPGQRLGISVVDSRMIWSKAVPPPPAVLGPDADGPPPRSAKGT